MNVKAWVFAVVSAVVPVGSALAQTGGGIGTLSPNLNTSGMHDISAGATVVGIGPGGGMRGGQVPQAIGGNWTTVNLADRSMGSTITGTGQFPRTAMAPGVGSNFTTVNGQDLRGQRGAVTFQFGQPNQRLPYGPGANINTAIGRDISLESAAINGWSNQYGGGGWQMNGLAPPGVGSNFTTVHGGDLGPEHMNASASSNRLGEGRWPYQSGARTFARGAAAPQSQAGYTPQTYAQWLSTQNRTGYSGIPLASGWAGRFGNRFFGSGVNGTSFTNYGSGSFGAGFYGNSFPANGGSAGAQYTGFTPSGFNGNGWNPSAMNAGFVPSGVNGGGWVPSGFNGNAFVPSASNANGFIPSGFNGNGG